MIEEYLGPFLAHVVGAIALLFAGSAVVLMVVLLVGKLTNDLDE